MYIVSFTFSAPRPANRVSDADQNFQTIPTAGLFTTGIVRYLRLRVDIQTEYPTG
jgi:hypothetical protein